MDSSAAPLFSIITPVYNVPVDVLRDTAASVLAQKWTDWEWILVDDCSPDAKVGEALQALAAQDPRITVHTRAENGGIVAASNDAVDRAHGTFLALLDHDDLLTRDALSRMASAIRRDADDIDYLYSDEDKIDDRGRRSDAFIKPDWSPERFRQQMYTCHFSVLRADLVREVGAFRSGFDGSQDWDLILRVTEKARRVHHVPYILYHWRIIPGSAAGDTGAKPYAWEAGRRAISEHLDRTGVSASVSYREDRSLYELVRRPDLTTPTSIIIPTRGSSGRVWGNNRCFLVEAVRSVAAHTNHTALEFVVVYDTDTPPAVIADLQAIPGIDLVLVQYSETFNFSAKCNAGAMHASGEILIFLNDDVEAISDEVVGQLIAPLSEPGVGMTGPKLLFENGRIQHAGLEYGNGSIAHTLYRELDEGSRDSELHINREVTGLTGACVALRAEVFQAVGGFTEVLPVNFNDVDFSLKIGREGLRLVWLCDVVLWHFESITRSPVVHQHEIDLITQRWGAYKTKRDKFARRRTAG